MYANSKFIMPRRPVFSNRKKKSDALPAILGIVDNSSLGYSLPVLQSRKETLLSKQLGIQEAASSILKRGT